ncbi:hypothetical protein [Sphingomonas changnyeongensis]|uniref:hypothetical protein n=1 Tax=Sphingomonas changnyeongensis TaxID=2698679 RepID=UPI00389A9F37
MRVIDAALLAMPCCGKRLMQINCNFPEGTDHSLRGRTNDRDFKKNNTIPARCSTGLSNFVGR